MKKALASVVVVVFAGLLCTSLFSLISGSPVSKQAAMQQAKFPYYMSY